MYFGLIKNAVHKRILVLGLIVMYVLLGLAACLYSVRQAKQDTVYSVKNQMNQLLSEYISNISLHSDTLAIDPRNLAASPVMSMPLLTGMEAQLKDYFQKIIEIDKTYAHLQNIAILDKNGKIIYSHGSAFSDSLYTPPKLTNIAYDRFVSGSSLYREFYFPIMYRNGLYGGILYIYDVADSKLVKQLFSQPERGYYSVFGIDRNNILFYTQEGKLNTQKIMLHTTLPQGLSKLPFRLKLDDGSSYMIYSSQPFKNTDGISTAIICIGVKESAFAKLQLSNVLGRVYSAGIIVIFFMIFSLILLILSGVYLNKKISARMLLQNMRVERHEFAKHLNILDGLVRYGDMTALKEYVNSLTREFVTHGEMKKVGNAAVEVLLYKKEEECQQNNICFEVNVNMHLWDLKISTLDLCRLLGNLLDNAIEACLKLPEDKRKILLTLSGEQGYLMITMANYAPSDNIDTKKWFKEGYTTKKHKARHGVGLYIVSKIVKKYKGAIHVCNNDGMIEFQILLH